MRVLLALLSLATILLSQEDASRVIDCNKIFEERKDELLAEVEKIDEQQQALQALQAATQAVLEKKEQVLTKREEDLNSTMSQMDER
ncbi:MAG: PDP protein, partial [Campylobacterales bacterium]